MPLNLNKKHFIIVITSLVITALFSISIFSNKKTLKNWTMEANLVDENNTTLAHIYSHGEGLSSSAAKSNAIEQVNEIKEEHERSMNKKLFFL